MHELMANLKKDFLGGIRSKKIYAYIFIPIGLLLFSVVGLLLMTSIEVDGTKQFKAEVMMLVSFFSMMMSAYYVLPMIFMLMGSVSKEMKEKKWLLPVCNGMDNKKMILSKCIIDSLIPTAFAFIGGMLSIVLGYILFANEIGATFFDLFLIILSMTINVLFYSLMTVSLSALTKRYLISAGIPIFCIMVASSILANLGIIQYTPFLFANYAPGMTESPLWWHWLIATAGVIVIDGGLIVSAMFKKKIVYI